MVKLSFKQQQFMNLLSGGFKFNITRGTRGFCVDTVQDVNSTLYLTLTMRSLIHRKLISVDLTGVKLTEQGVEHQRQALN